MRHALLVATLFAFAACASSPASGTGSRSSGGGVVGAPSSRAAAEGFMTAVKATDLQAMAALWGNDKGPARDRIARDELDKRLIVMQCLLQHDKWSFVEDSPRLNTGARQGWQISLTRKGATARTELTTVPGPGGRWFLENADLQPLRAFCS